MIDIWNKMSLFIKWCFKFVTSELKILKRWLKTLAGFLLWIFSAVYSVHAVSLAAEAGLNAKISPVDLIGIKALGLCLHDDETTVAASIENGLCAILIGLKAFAAYMVQNPWAIGAVAFAIWGLWVCIRDGKRHYRIWRKRRNRK